MKRSVSIFLWGLLGPFAGRAQSHAALQFVALEDGIQIAGLSVRVGDANARLTDAYGLVDVPFENSGFEPGKQVRITLTTNKWRFYNPSDELTTLLHPNERLPRKIILCDRSKRKDPASDRQFGVLTKLIRTTDAGLQESMTGLKDTLLAARDTILQALEKHFSGARTDSLSSRQKTHRGWKAWQRGDAQEACQWWGEAADAGDPDAENYLGTMLKLGDGVQQDGCRALHWYQQAAEKDHPLAMANLAVMYYYGNCVAADKQKAVELWKKSAELGCPLALHGLGTYYEAEEAFDLARTYFEKNAAQDFPSSLYALGTYYCTGRGSLKRNKENQRTGCDYIRRSANLGYQLASKALNTNQFNCQKCFGIFTLKITSQ